LHQTFMKTLPRGWAGGRSVRKSQCKPSPEVRLMWNLIRFAKHRPAADRASVSPAQEARPSAADPVPQRRRSAPLLDVSPAAQARALVSLLQEQDHGIENHIRTPEMRQTYLEMCAREGWRPCKWNPLARELTLITTGGKKVYSRFQNDAGTTTKQRVYPIPPRSEPAQVDPAAEPRRFRVV
jgi:hypothetical protein